VKWRSGIEGTCAHDESIEQHRSVVVYVSDVAAWQRGSISFILTTVVAFYPSSLTTLH
jgi:hypothetical protein